MTLRVLYSAQYHRQPCTLHAFEKFGALYMHNHDDKDSARPRFEPGTSRLPWLQYPVDTKETSGPAPEDGMMCEMPLPTEHATSRSRRLLTILNLYEWAGKKHIVSLKLKCQSGARTRDLQLSKQAALTTHHWSVVTIVSDYCGPKPKMGESYLNCLGPNMCRWQQRLFNVKIKCPKPTINTIDSIIFFAYCLSKKIAMFKSTP